MKSKGEKLTATCEISPDDLRAHRWFSRAQRLVWVIMALVLVGAIAGLLGSGPLNDGRAGKPGSEFWVEYERRLHYQARSDLKLHIGPAATREGRVRFFAGNGFLEGVELTRMDPAPAAVLVESGRRIYWFQAGTNQPVQIRVSFQPDSYGRLAYEVGLVDGPRLRLKQFVFP